jgi:hypothetical protein
MDGNVGEITEGDEGKKGGERWRYKRNNFPWETEPVRVLRNRNHSDGIS